MDEREINEAVVNIAKAPLQAFGRGLQELVVTLGEIEERARAERSRLAPPGAGSLEDYIAACIGEAYARGARFTAELMAETIFGAMPT